MTINFFSDGLAVDWMNSKIYFTDATKDIIGVYDLTSSNYSALIGTGNNTRPRSIVVDPSAGYV